ncbi:MAG: nucleotidyltransferase family protein [Proteobacteria bacterium]|nr:nucleotidyltransferase family protein [Pseudomonadota bacterium]
MQKIYTVILAAGTSSRLGFNKLTVKIDGQSVITRAVESFCVEGIEKIFVVTNPESLEIKKDLEDFFLSRSMPVVLVNNPYYRDGMSSSVKAALPFIEDADSVFFHLGDKPFIKRETISSMLDMYLRDGVRMLIPEYKNKKGHPVMMKIKLYLEEMKVLTGDRGLREIIDKHMEDVVLIKGDEGSVFDIDTVETINLLKERGYRIEKG